MPRRVGLAIAAVVLSITLGVLIGMVIHTGRAERADDPPIQPSGAATSSTASGPESRVEQVTGPAHHSPDDPTRASTSASDTSTNTVTDGSTTPPPTTGPTDPTDDSRTGDPTTSVTTPSSKRHAHSSRATRTGDSRATRSRNGATTPRVVRTTASTTNTATTNAATAGTATAGTATQTSGRARTSRTPRPGSDAPNGPCGTLGEKSATAGGATLFCQHDQTNGALRWRAVTDGGGCLNRTMRGTGLDGHHYACRRGRDGLNHWKRTH